jgi:LPXTG-motif cell wall-anchored protein
MNRFNAVAAIGCLALMGALAPGVKADEWNRKTVMTFSGPVEIPGVHLTGWGILPAGTYVFKILDSQSDRHIVQIFNKEETTIYATILAIPNYRLKATDKTVVTFRERPAGQPEALRAWFYPGRNWGEEFVYPKARAMELAKESSTPVLFSSAEVPVEVAEPIRRADAPAVVVLKQAPVMAYQPTGEEVQLAQVVTAPPAEELAMTSSLPATGSQTPLMALFGAIAFGGGLALLAIRKRTIVRI